MSPLWITVTLVLLSDHTRGARPFLYTTGEDDEESPIANNTFGGNLNNELEEETEEAVANLLRCLDELYQEIDSQESMGPQTSGILEHGGPRQPMLPIENPNFDVDRTEGSSLRRFFSEFSWNDEDDGFEPEFQSETVKGRIVDSPHPLPDSSSSTGEESGLDLERKRQYSEAFSAVHNLSHFLDAHFEDSEENPTNESNIAVADEMDGRWEDVLKVLTDAIEALNSVTSRTSTQRTEQETTSEDETWHEVFNILDSVHHTLETIAASHRQNDVPPPPKQTKLADADSPGNIAVIMSTSSTVLQELATAGDRSGSPWAILDLLSDLLFNTKSAALFASASGLQWVMF